MVDGKRDGNREKRELLNKLKNQIDVWKADSRQMRRMMGNNETKQA